MFHCCLWLKVSGLRGVFLALLPTQSADGAAAVVVTQFTPTQTLLVSTAKFPIHDHVHDSALKLSILMRRSVEVDLLLEPASSGHLMTSSLWHLGVGFPFQLQRLPLPCDVFCVMKQSSKIDLTVCVELAASFTPLDKMNAAWVSTSAFFLFSFTQCVYYWCVAN